jgi:hypothetical protein
MPALILLRGKRLRLPMERTIGMCGQSPGTPKSYHEKYYLLFRIRVRGKTKLE